MDKDLPAARKLIQNQTDDWRDMNIEKESPEERELFERMPQHPSREQLMAEVAVLTELVRVLSGRVAELEKTEQEPVEWGVDWGKDGNSVSIIKRRADGNIEVLAWEYAPHPQQRTWVGLTQDELNMIGDSMRTWNSWTITDVYFAIEAKLKAKNNG